MRATAGQRPDPGGPPVSRPPVPPVSAPEFHPLRDRWAFPVPRLRLEEREVLGEAGGALRCRGGGVPGRALALPGCPTVLGCSCQWHHRLAGIGSLGQEGKPGPEQAAVFTELPSRRPRKV